MWIAKAVLGAAALIVQVGHKKLGPKIKEAKKAELQKQGLYPIDLLITEEENDQLSANGDIADVIVNAAERRAQHESR